MGFYFFGGVVNKKTGQITGFLLLIALGYAYWGSASLVLQSHQLQEVDKALKTLKTELPTLSQEAALGRLADLSRQAGKNPFIWVRLGSVYARMGWWERAEEAYEQAYQVRPEPEIGAGYLNAFFMRSGGHFSKKSIRILDQVLVSDPKNQMALNLKALYHIQNAECAQAQERWEQLLWQLDPDDPLRSSIAQLIKQCRLNKGEANER